MASPRYVVKEGGLADRFRLSRNKLQIIGGGFGNGKTTNVCIRALELARQYPGSNGLMARSTYPKLNDTLRKEFLKWCPKHWIKSFPMSNNGSNTCTLANGTTINFRYVQQKSGGEETGTSNLLSATYDWIVVDQIEDPEIVEKDFLDLFGRLRGNTPYVGNDPTMPRTGPRWLVVTCNPTRNWFYKKVILPLHIYNSTGTMTAELICRRDVKTKKPLLVDNKPQLLVDLFEGSTYENAHILEPDFIETLETLYQGQMKERFLLGKWGAYEGLVYPDYHDLMHTLDEHEIANHLEELQRAYTVNFFEGYDFGIAVPSCYGLFFVDKDGNVFLLDGFYKKELGINQQADKIRAVRFRWGLSDEEQVFADPAIFRRYGSTDAGETTSMLFEKQGIRMRRANRDKMAGIVKVNSYMHIRRYHSHPITRTAPAPTLFINRNLAWFADEIGNYYWKKDSRGNIDDSTQDKDDHAMDMLRFALTDVPEVATVDVKKTDIPSWLNWHENELASRKKDFRHGR